VGDKRGRKTNADEQQLLPTGTYRVVASAQEAHPYHLLLRAAFDEDGTALQAHVWVRCGPLVVTGGGHGRRFAPLTWFADIRPLDSLP
jgi:hypothetical protein